LVFPPSKSFGPCAYRPRRLYRTEVEREVLDVTLVSRSSRSRQVAAATHTALAFSFKMFGLATVAFR